MKLTDDFTIGGKTLIQLAMEKSDLKAIKTLVEANPSLDRKPVLAWAASHSHEELFNFLYSQIPHDDLKTLTDQNNNCLLQMAILGNNPNIVATLLAAFPEQMTHQNKAGKDALALACSPVYGDRERQRPPIIFLLAGACAIQRLEQAVEIDKDKLCPFPFSVLDGDQIKGILSRLKQDQLLNLVTRHIGVGLLRGLVECLPVEQHKDVWTRVYNSTEQIRSFNFLMASVWEELAPAARAALVGCLLENHYLGRALYDDYDPSVKPVLEGIEPAKRLDWVFSCLLQRIDYTYFSYPEKTDWLDFYLEFIPKECHAEFASRMFSTDKTATPLAKNNIKIASERQPGRSGVPLIEQCPLAWAKKLVRLLDSAQIKSLKSETGYTLLHRFAADPDMFRIVAAHYTDSEFEEAATATSGDHLSLASPLVLARVNPESLAYCLSRLTLAKKSGVITPELLTGPISGDSYSRRPSSNSIAALVQHYPEAGRFGLVMRALRLDPQLLDDSKTAVAIYEQIPQQARLMLLFLSMPSGRYFIETLPKNQEVDIDSLKDEVTILRGASQKNWRGMSGSMDQYPALSEKIISSLVDQIAALPEADRPPADRLPKAVSEGLALKLNPPMEEVPLREESDEDALKEQFFEAYRSASISKNQSFLRMWGVVSPVSTIQDTATLAEILVHAKAHKTAAEVCRQLGWMDQKGNIPESAPDAVRNAAQGRDVYSHRK